MNDAKPTISEVRAAWKRGIASTPDASQLTISRAILELQKPVITSQLSLTDFVLGTALCVALSLLAVLPSEQIFNESASPDLVNYIGQDAFQEAFSG